MTEPAKIKITHVYHGGVYFDGDPSPVEWLREHLPADQAAEFFTRYAGQRVRIPKIGAPDFQARDAAIRERFCKLRAMGVSYQDRLRLLAGEQNLSKSRIEDLISGAGR